ncbi:MAG: TolC family protein [Dysgonamonadaceae bacterium]|nr:TolC family protein [Dysgonamonadaceae bacterium]
MNKRIILFILIMGYSLNVAAQLSVEACQKKARENYPLVKKYGLIAQSKAYSLSNAAKGYLPQFSVNAKLSYQSDVTAVPLSLPGIEIPKPSKDQYQAVIEANQTVWDGGIIRSQQKITQAGSEAESKQLEVELYALDERVNELFFGILLLDARLAQNRILQEELGRNFRTIASYIENGIANQTDLDAVKVEQLNTEQHFSQLQSTRTAYMEMLSIMTGIRIDDGMDLIKPDIRNALPATQINRPELQWFDAQNKLLDSQKDLLQSAYMPRLGLFVQAGIGRPGLNMLSNNFDPFYIGGLRLTWNFGALYTQKNDLRKIEVNKGLVETQRAVFLYNINLALSRENQDIKRLRDLMKYDDEIIALRENIRKAAESKVANGTITVTELMQELSKEDLARQTKVGHEIDFLIAIYNLKNTTNN